LKQAPVIYDGKPSKYDGTSLSCAQQSCNEVVYYDNAATMFPQREVVWCRRACAGTVGPVCVLLEVGELWRRARAPAGGDICFLAARLARTGQSVSLIDGNK